MKFIRSFILWAVVIAYLKANLTEASKALQPRLIKPLGGVLPSSLNIDNLIPGSVAQNIKGMQDEYDPEWTRQTIANYVKPASPNVEFYLHCKRNNTKEVYKLNIGDMDALDKTCFVKNASVKFLVHGWLQTHKIPCYFPDSTKDSYLEFDVSPNIIVMDYSNTTLFLVYPVAVYTSVTEGGHAGAAFLEPLVANNYVAPSQIHVIGLSLGAHVAGYLAWIFYTRTHQKLSRVTGLDPAGPWFDVDAAAYILNSGVAYFVDVYHTGKYGLGTGLNLGHVDYNVNGGKWQCYCLDIGCNHIVSAYDYEMTIQNGPEDALICACYGNPATICLRPNCCDYLISFGEYIDYKTRGVHTILIPLIEFYGPFFKTIEKCVHLI